MNDEEETGRADRSLKALCNLFPRSVTRRVAQRIVDLPKTIEIQQQHRATAVLDLLRVEDLFERLGLLKAI